MSDEPRREEPTRVDEFRFFDLWERGRGFRAASRHQLPWIEARSERLPPLFAFSSDPGTVAGERDALDR